MRRVPLGQVGQRILQRQTKVLLVERLPELGADRILGLVGRHLQSGRERMAGLERAGDQIERLRELLLELARPSTALHVQHDGRKGRADRGADEHAPAAAAP